MLTEKGASSRRRRDPWNKGRLIGQKRPLKPKDVWTIRVRLQLEDRKRDLALFDLAIDSKLRGCDLVRLQIDDVCAGGRVRDRATVIQKKTGRPVQFEITEQTRAAVADWLSSLGSLSGHSYLFPSRFRQQPYVSTRQYARIVHRWVERAGLDSTAYGTHSMRRTKPAQIYKKTGNLRAVQLLLGHTKLESVKQQATGTPDRHPIGTPLALVQGCPGSNGRDPRGAERPPRVWRSAAREGPVCPPGQAGVALRRGA
jgi:integrase